MSATPSAEAPQPRGIRQTMSDLHIWTGLLAGWFLFAMFLTGTVSYFKDETSQWMRPEIPAQSDVPDAAEVAGRIVHELETLAPGSPSWSVRLPDARKNTASAFWRVAPPPAAASAPAGRGGGNRRAFGEATFDPATGHKVSARDTTGGEFFYRFHFQFHYMPVLWGRWLAGLCAMFMLVAIVSGVITHKKIFVDFFTFRWGKGQRSWLDAHNALSVFGLPFHLMITYTGLVTLMTLYFPWGQQQGLDSPALRQQMNAELTAFITPGKPTGQAVRLASVEAMVREAQQRWGRDNVARVTVTNPGDASSRVAIARGEDGLVSMKPIYLVFDGGTGRLLEEHDSVGGAAETRGVMYGLHLGRFGDTTMRWLYFIVSLAGTAMVGTGLVMWTVKRRTRLPDPARPHVGFWLVEKLNIAAIAGLPVAMAAFLWANRLLPTRLPQRGDWEIHVLFIVWGALLVHALVRPSRRAWLEQLWLGVAALALLPVVSALTTDRPLWHSLATGDRVFALYELMLWALAALLAAVAVRAARAPKLKAKAVAGARAQAAAPSGSPMPPASRPMAASVEPQP